MRPTAADLGLNRLATLLFATNATIALVSLPLYSRVGLSFDWPTFLPTLIALSFAISGWLFHYFTPGPENEWPIAESLVVFALLASCTMVLSPAQYLAVAYGGPLADPWLAQADALLGLSVPSVVEWVRPMSWLVHVLSIAYDTLLPQFILAVVLLGAWFKDREGLWEFAFHFQFCLLLTLIGLALFPAACVFSFYGFESLLDQTRFIRHFSELRSGTFTVIRLNDMEGLISFPSFHVAGALLVTWAFRRHVVLLLALGVLNMVLILSTVLLGAHYVIDLPASFAVVGLSIWVYQRWVRDGLLHKKSSRKQYSFSRYADARPAVTQD